MEEIPEQEFIKGSEGHLRTAAKQLDKIGQHNIGVLQDPQGIFCFEYPDFFLIAKGYLFKGSDVSCQRETVLRAKRKHKRLVVYVAEKDAFYLFYPQDIIDDHWENWRRKGPYKLLMYNWDYTIGEEVFQNSRRFE